jgi:hypothetical protein
LVVISGRIVDFAAGFFLPSSVGVIVGSSMEGLSSERFKALFPKAGGMDPSNDINNQTFVLSLLMPFFLMTHTMNKVFPSVTVNQLQDELEAKACPPPPPPPPLPPPPLAMSHPRTCTASLRQGSCVSVADTGARVETGNPVLDMANMLGIPRRPATAAVLPGGKDSQQSGVFLHPSSCWLLAWLALQP